MMYREPESGAVLLISDELLEEIRQVSVNHYPKEFGGIFYGNYSDENTVVNIEGILVPNKFRHSRTSFCRFSTDLNKKLKQLYKESKGGLYYIGEWHTHPNGNSSPSKTDFITMQKIASDKKVKIDTPLLLISVMTKIKFEPYFSLFHDNNLKPYEKVD